MNHRLDPRVAALTLIAVGIACLPLILIGPQTGDSLYTNLSWASQFTEELFAGQWYPRWLAGLNAGAGSPVFFFYAPLPFYVTAAASMVCRPCGAVIQLGLAEALAQVLDAHYSAVGALATLMPTAAEVVLAPWLSVARALRL